MKHWFKTSVWAFPLVLFLILVALSALRINGSSIGVYHSVLYGNQSRDPDLLYGHPQTIRSDEWLVNTQENVAQSKAGYPKVNPYMGRGRDVSLQADVASKDWSTIFKPQNWSFMVLPLEQAFAFKWWLLMYGLMVSCYFFTLRILTDKKLFAILFALAAGLSPFALWWYQTSIFMGLAYGFLAIILGVRLLNGESVRFVKDKRTAVILQTLALGFIGACFGLILYPPFQIPIAIVVLAYLLGHLINKWQSKKADHRLLLKRVGYLVAAGAIAAIVGAAFVVSHRDTIHKLTSTLYPGHRLVESGGLNMLSLFDGFLMPVEQSDFRGTHFFTNQSEAANFIMLMPFLLLPGFLLAIREYKKKHQVDWVFLLMLLSGLVFLLRAFVPYGSTLYKPLLLDRVPNGRLVIGMGFVGFILFVYMVKKLAEAKIPKPHLTTWSLLYSISCFLVLLWTGAYVVEHYPLFLHSWPIVIGLAGAFTAIIVALLANRPLLAACFLLVFTLASGFRVMPIYRGLGFATDNKVAQAIDRVSAPGDRWATIDDIYFENIGYLAGRSSIGGMQIYPDIGLWRQAGGQKYDKVYNREGHAIFSDDPSLNEPLRLFQPNAYNVRFACTPFVTKYVNYALASHPLDYPCVKQVDTVKYPNVTFYLYKVTSVTQ